MKDYTREELEEGRPGYSAYQTIGRCLDCLFTDKTHTINDEVVKGLTFEELIGALLQARDLARQEE